MTTTATRRVFRLPDLGEGLTDAEIVAWKVGVGDRVEIDQIVAEVETAKAIVEVPVPYAGKVLRLHAEAGAVLSVGEPLIEIDPEDDDTDPAAARYREEERAGSGNVLIGYGTDHAPRARRRRRGGPRAAVRKTSPAAQPIRQASGTPRQIPTGQRLRQVPTTASPDPADTAPGTPTALASRRPATSAPLPERAPARAPRVISPLVRRIARDHGLDLAAITPTGPRGVILRRDVDRAIAEAGLPGDDPGLRQALAENGGNPASTPSPAAPGPAAERVPLRGLRRAVAEKLTRSRSEIPDATTWVDVDATALLAVKDDLKRRRPDLGIGLLAILARICVAGLLRFPELNSSVDAARGEIIRYRHVNLGFAAQTDRGLIVPVVRDAHLMTTDRLAAELTRLTALARSGGLPPTALTGGTFTLNNYGVFGVDGSTPIINHPEAAILGVGRVIDRPWVVDGTIAPRKIAQMSLTFDHRVCDGGTAGGFLRFVADCVENPAILLAHL